MDKYTLWEVVTMSGNRKALVKTENLYPTEKQNLQHGKFVVASYYSPKFFDFGEFSNGGYDLDECRCKLLKTKWRTKQC